jgi:ABC-type transport system involved in multi-copper enzyme maturation permease subunit
MLTHIRTIFLVALRDRLFAGLLAGILAATLIARTLGSTAMLEPEAMGLAFAAAGNRLILMVGLMVFVAFHVRHLFETREMELLLSRPLGRVKLLLGLWLGYVLVGLLLALPAIGLVAWLDPVRGTGLALWAASIVLEAWLVISFTLFVSVTLGSGVMAVLASLGFYVLSRMMGFFVMITQSAMTDTTSLGANAKWVLTAISAVIPRLDFFSKTEWLMYGTATATAPVWLFALQAAIFIPLLLAASCIDFKRKQF